MLIRSCTVALLLVACSHVPPASFPEHADYAVDAEYVVPADGRLRMPSSSWELVVHELRAEPPPVREWFGDGGRWFVYAPGTAVRVRCRCRAYAAPDGRVATPADVLPGAAHIRGLEEP